ncbi:MAG: SprT-like domain-containing protein [bacterium]
MRYLVILILLCSCSDEYVFNVESELSGYVESFFELSKQHGKNLDKNNLTVRFSKEIGSLHGVYIDRSGLNIIEINYYHYQNYSRDYMEAIVFHELGHAILKRQHDDSVESLMNTSLCLMCYSENKSYFINELFK